MERTNLLDLKMRILNRYKYPPKNGSTHESILAGVLGKTKQVVGSRQISCKKRFFIHTDIE